MPEMPCRSFTRKEEIILKFKETGGSGHICQNKLDRTCFHHDVAYVDFKDLPRRTVFGKLFRKKAFDITKI